jgi:hypothetical protein
MEKAKEKGHSESKVAKGTAPLTQQERKSHGRARDISSADTTGKARFAVYDAKRLF